MIANRTLLFTASIGALWFIPACSGSAEGGAGKPSAGGPGVGSQKANNVLAEAVLSSTHRVQFLEPQPGVLLVSETGAIGVDDQSSVGDFVGAADLYGRLVTNPDESKLAQLREADERAQALNQTAAALSLPQKLKAADNEVTLQRKHDSFLFGPQCQQSSFEGNYCVEDRWNQIVSSGTGWQDCTSRFRSTVFQHQYTENDAPTDHMVFYYGTRGDFWDEVADTWVQPNTWQSWFSTYIYVEVVTNQVSGQANQSDHDQCVLEAFRNCPGGLLSGDDVVGYVCPN